MIPLIISFLVLLNPFAMFIYLSPIMKELEHKTFLKVLLRATIISFVIFTAFLFSGDFLFREIFHIRFESFQIFGGIIIFTFAFFFIVKGQKALIQMKEDLQDLASEIALPWMVGAGTITITILMSYNLVFWKGLIALVIILVVNYLVIFVLKMLRDSIKKPQIQVAFDKNMEILLRINGFFVGAIGINMVLSGVLNVIEMAK